jgi:hypothetical protein
MRRRPSPPLQREARQRGQSFRPPRPIRLRRKHLRWRLLSPRVRARRKHHKRARCDTLNMCPTLRNHPRALRTGAIRSSSCHPSPHYFLTGNSLLSPYIYLCGRCAHPGGRVADPRGVALPGVLSPQKSVSPSTEYASMQHGKGPTARGSSRVQTAPKVCVGP